MIGSGEYFLSTWVQSLFLFCFSSRTGDLLKSKLENQQKKKLNPIKYFISNFFDYYKKVFLSL